MQQNAEQAKLSKAAAAKSKKDVRPLSGGIQKLMKHGERSRITNSQHNMSMFDKIGSNNPNGMQGSPGPMDFKPANYNSLKPMGHKMQHNSSFDSMPIHNQLGQLQVQHHQSSLEAPYHSDQKTYQCEGTRSSLDSRRG